MKYFTALEKYFKNINMTLGDKYMKYAAGFY